MAGPPGIIDQETYIEINKYDNGTPTHQTTRDTINQKENPRYIPRGKV